MNTNMELPHKFENGIELIRVSDRGARLISDGYRVTWIQGCWMREDGSLTPRGMQALLMSEQTVEDYQNKLKEKEEQRKAYKVEQERKFQEGKELVTVEIEKGILFSSSNAWKYKCGRGYNMYHKITDHWMYIPKSVMNVTRKNNKVYCTAPKWMARKHFIIFGEID